MKGLDTWVFYPSTTLLAPLNIISTAGAAPVANPDPARPRSTPRWWSRPATACCGNDTGDGHHGHRPHQPVARHGHDRRRRLVHLHPDDRLHRPGLLHLHDHRQRRSHGDDDGLDHRHAGGQARLGHHARRRAGDAAVGRQRPAAAASPSPPSTSRPRAPARPRSSTARSSTRRRRATSARRRYTYTVTDASRPDRDGDRHRHGRSRAKGQGRHGFWARRPDRGPAPADQRHAQRHVATFDSTTLRLTDPKTGKPVTTVTLAGQGHLHPDQGRGRDLRAGVRVLRRHAGDRLHRQRHRWAARPTRRSWSPSAPARRPYQTTSTVTPARR